METNDKDYAQYFFKLRATFWKKLLPVHVAYKYNIRRLCQGHVLDVGCGPGRHLLTLSGRSVGVDHNPFFVKTANNEGLRAFLPKDFKESKYGVSCFFDTVLFSHVLEHQTFEGAVNLMKEYLVYVKKKGRIVIVVPQILGFKFDPTHLTHFDEVRVRELAKALNLNVIRVFSYPFPKVVGTVFRQNELVAVLKR